MADSPLWGAYSLSHRRLACRSADDAADVLLAAPAGPFVQQSQGYTPCGWRDNVGLLYNDVLPPGDASACHRSRFEGQEGRRKGAVSRAGLLGQGDPLAGHIPFCPSFAVHHQGCRPWLHGADCGSFRDCSSYKGYPQIQPADAGNAVAVAGFGGQQPYRWPHRGWIYGSVGSAVAHPLRQERGWRDDRQDHCRCADGLCHRVFRRLAAVALCIAEPGAQQH